MVFEDFFSVIRKGAGKEFLFELSCIKTALEQSTVNKKTEEDVQFRNREGFYSDDGT